jgi:hypothetical protein
MNTNEYRTPGAQVEGTVASKGRFQACSIQINEYDLICLQL